MTEPKKLHGIKELAVGRSDTFRLSLDDLHVKAGWNARDCDFDPTDEEDLALAQSIAEVGVRETMTAVWEDGRAYVTNGHRRRAAALYARDTLGAEIKSVPVQTEARYSSEADHVLSQIVRNAGKPLSPFEKGRVFKRLIDLGWDEDEIAKKTGITRNRVVQLLTVQAAPEGVKTLVREGSVSTDLALKAVRASDGDGDAAVASLTEAVETAKAEGKTRATAKHLDAGTGAKLTLKRAVKEAFEVADVADGDEFVTISVPRGHYDRLREAAGL